ncbi:MAG TPA: TolC family protein [Steroidobacteraceae bacterium]|nr:TolC family protein [Steroidobacteraceae bacterium]
MLAALTGCAALLSGCATYHSKPLPGGPDLARSPALTVPAGSLGVPGLRSDPFDPTRGLTETNIVALAVAANPRLRAARLKAGVARAQLLAAGLLPDPQISGGLSQSSFFTGYSATLAQDIQALVTRSAAKDTARAHLEEVNLDILWREWQVGERARELYIQTVALAELRGVLDQQRRLLGKLQRDDETLLAHGDLTVGEATADFMACNSAEAQWRAFELQDNQTRHALDELLGLAPGTQLRLRDAREERQVTAAGYRSALAALPRRRPDLRALQAGYHSAQEQLRAAILAQFPLISAGVTKARSAEDGIQSIGFDVTLTLPLFDRNRGPIAAGRASRAYLHQTYQASLDETTSQADQVWQAVVIMRYQLRRLDQRLAGLERAATAARDSLGRGTLTFADYARVQSDALATEAEEIGLRSALAQAQSALSLLLALPF